MKLTGARILCECLQAEGVKIIFGLPGGAIMPLYDVLPEYPFHHVLVRHEQGAAHMADGYTRISGQPGVCMGTSGPGATNLVTGLLTAHMDSVGMVAITANVPTTAIGSDAFQEADATGITIPVTKQNYLVRSARDIARAVKEAFYLARTGRPGPVHVDIPKDVLQQEAEFAYPDSVDLPSYEPTLQGNMVQIRKAARLIEESRRPVIMAGHGVLISRAWDELREFAEKANVPVINTLLGLGGFPGTHPLSLGLPGMHGWVHCNYGIHHSDLLIAIGMRMDDRVCGKFSAFAPQAKIIHIDIDPAEIGKNVRADVPIVGDVKRVLEKLTPEVGACADRGPWFDQIRAWREQFPPQKAGPDPRKLYTPQVVDGLYASTKGNAIVVADVGQHQMFVAQHYPFDHPNSFITTGGLGTMGYSLPAAIGAQFAASDKTVWCVVGDGSFQMTMQELAVAALERVPIKIALMNNVNLGMVRQWQQLFYKGNYVAVDLSGPPDYVKLAEAYGIPAWRVEQPDDVAFAVKAASNHPGPALVEFRIDPNENCFPMVVPGTALSECIPDETYTELNGRTAGAAPARRQEVPASAML